MFGSLGDVVVVCLERLGDVAVVCELYFRRLMAAWSTAWYCSLDESVEFFFASEKLQSSIINFLLSYRKYI